MARRRQQQESPVSALGYGRLSGIGALSCLVALAAHGAACGGTSRARCVDDQGQEVECLQRLDGGGDGDGDGDGDADADPTPGGPAGDGDAGAGDGRGSVGVGVDDEDDSDDDAGALDVMTGTLCDEDPCMHGTCVVEDDGQTLRCECDDGWEGNACEVDIDDCAPDPCVNGGCVDEVAGFRCECDAGWNGARCDTDVALDFIQQVIAANATPEPDVIVLTDDVPLDAVHNMDGGPNGVPVITTPITVEGGGLTIRRVAGSPQFRLFAVSSSGALTLDDVVVEGGDAEVGTGCFTDNTQCGGGVQVQFGGELTVRDGTRFVGNRAWGGGAIFNGGGGVLIEDAQLGASGAPNVAEYGGAIFATGNTASTTIVGAAFDSNVAVMGGGAIHNQAELFIADSSFDGNRVTDLPTSGGGGGALSNLSFSGQVQIANSSFRGNSSRLGGAISNDNASSILMHDCDVADNSAPDFGNGGGIASDNNTALHLYSSRVTGNDADQRGGGIYAGRNLNSEILMVSSTLASNTAGNDGGGLMLASSNMSVLSEIMFSTIADNVAGQDGGGIYKDGFSPLHITGSLITRNLATPPNGAGGGVWFDNPTSNDHAHSIVATTISDNEAGEGAGFHSVAFTGTITIEQSTIADNTTITSGAVGQGGAGIDNQHGNVVVRHTTISGNRVESSTGVLSGSGAAVHHGNGGVVELDYCTLVGNASRDGGGIRAQSEVTISNSVLANTATNGPNCNPVIPPTDGGNNHVDDGTEMRGTAAWGHDYLATPSLSATFTGASWPAPGASETVALSLDVQPDARVEGDETVVLTLLDQGIRGPAELGPTTQHVLTIRE